MKKILLLAIFLLFLYIYVSNNFNKQRQEKCIISLNKYPELKILEENKNLIIQDLNKIINKKWINYESIHNDNFDYFSQVKEKDVFKKFEKLETSLNDDLKTPSWKTQVLIFNGKLTKYSKELDNTINLLKKISGIKHAGFSCFEPGAISNYHTDNNFDTYRYHLPLIIPEGNCKLKIYNKLYKFNKPMIFDDSCKHQVWNKTNFNRIIMIIDIYRKN
jgi:ornithine lipid ester-linked acyl 2-hydroxylase